MDTNYLRVERPHLRRQGVHWGLVQADAVTVPHSAINKLSFSNNVAVLQLVGTISQ